MITFCLAIMLVHCSIQRRHINFKASCLHNEVPGQQVLTRAPSPVRSASREREISRWLCCAGHGSWHGWALVCLSSPRWSSHHLVSLHILSHRVTTNTQKLYFQSFAQLVNQYQYHLLQYEVAHPKLRSYTRTCKLGCWICYIFCVDISVSQYYRQ